jgi:alpha-galactosidase
MFYGRDKFKFVFIGAGSASFTMQLAGDILMEKSITGGSLALVDVDEKKLRKAEQGVKELVNHTGSNFTVETHLHYSTALDQADFVFFIYAIGGIESWKQDIDICTRHGVLQSVGDTIGPGGMIRIMRSIPLALEIAHEMEEVCPHAYIINYTNPEGAQCYAIQKYSRIRCFGLCHGTPNAAQQLAQKVFHVHKDRFRYEAAGVNHLTWFTKMAIDGEDVYPKLMNAIETSDLTEKEPISFDLFKIFGLYPAPQDRHVSEFFSSFLRDRVLVEKNYVWKNNDFAAIDRWRKQGAEQMEGLIQDRKGHEKFLAGSGEKATLFTRALSTGEINTEMVNVPNKGYILNISNDIIVEVPAYIDSFGIHPQGGITLPDGIAARCDSLGREYKLLVEAAVKCDPMLFLQAAYLDPLCATCDYPEKLVRDLIQQNLDLLPEGWKQYQPDIFS